MIRGGTARSIKTEQFFFLVLEMGVKPFVDDVVDNVLDRGVGEMLEEVDFFIEGFVKVDGLGVGSFRFAPSGAFPFRVGHSPTLLGFEFLLLFSLGVFVLFRFVEKALI